MIRWLFIISCSFLFLSCQQVPQKEVKLKGLEKTEQLSAKKTTKANTLEDILTQKTNQPAEVVQWLKKCAKDCLHPDAEIAKDLADGYEILFALAAKNPRYETLTQKQYAQAEIGQTKVREGFVKILKFKNGRDILQTAYLELSNQESLYSFQDPELDKLVQQTIQRLLKNPETRPTAYFMQALSLPPIPENLLKTIGAYQNCYLSSKKKDNSCLLLYQEAVRYYERPRCTDGNFRNGIIFSNKKDGSHVLFATSDLLEATLDKTSNEIDGPRWEIWLSLKTFSIEKVEEALQFADRKDQVSEKDDSNGDQFKADQHEKIKELYIFHQQKILAKDKLTLSFIKDGQIRFGVADEKSAQHIFEKICQTPKPYKIPDQLRIRP